MMVSGKHSKYFTVLALLLVVIVAVGVGLLRRFVWPAHGIDHIILISIDTCRADYLSCYGYSQQTTPNIDAVAAEGILFENTITPVPMTLPAHSSMLTGTIPPYHGVHDNVNYKLSKSNLTLAEVLGANGFKTAAIISAFVLDSQFGIAQGFDTYNDQFEEAHVAVGISERKGGEATRFALEWLEKQKGEKSFLFLHYFDPHYDYVPPEPFASRFADNPYAGEVAYTDHCIGQVLDKLKELGFYDSTLIIITSDHGEMLGEHGEDAHGYFIYQSAIRVPLIFKLPRSRESHRISELVGLVDIVPTICSMLGITVPQQVQGQDLSPYFNGKSPASADRNLYCETVEPVRFDANSLLGIVNESFKYIQTTRPELYDLIKDPAESNNLVEAQQPRARIMKDTLAQLLEQCVREDATDSRITLDTQALKRLESLGYLRGGTTEPFKFDQSKKDPKDLIEFVMCYEGGIILAHQHKHDQAIAAYDKAIELNPAFAMPYNSRALMYSAKGDYDRAIRDFDQAIKLDPEFTNAYHDRGFMYLTRGDLDRAIRDFDQAIELDPANADVYNNRGLAYYGKGDYDRAIRNFDQAIELNPEYAEVYNNRAQLYLRKGKHDLAIRDYDQSIKLNPKNVQAYTERGFAYYGKGDRDQAIRDFSEAIRLNPSYALAYQSRGLAYQSKGDNELAIRDFGKAIELNPADALSHKAIGQVLMGLGRAKEATKHYRRALELRGDWPEVLNDLAWILATHEDPELRNGAEALRFAERVCQLQNYKAPAALDTLAAAYAEAGHFDQAVETAEKAVRLALAAGQQELGKGIRNRLKLYQAKRPYHESFSPEGLSRPESK